MSLEIVLDSSPLALVVQPPRYSQGDLCRDWLRRHVGSGSKVYVPEIIEYELRRELLRLNKIASLRALDIFLTAVPGRLLTIPSSDLRLAAELWARARQAGKPTADPHALDIDVILSAQILNATWSSTPIVATTNVKHLTQFVDAREWNTV